MNSELKKETEDLGNLLQEAKSKHEHVKSLMQIAGDVNKEMERILSQDNKNLKDKNELLMEDSKLNEAKISSQEQLLSQQKTIINKLKCENENHLKEKNSLKNQIDENKKCLDSYWQCCIKTRRDCGEKLEKITNYNVKLLQDNSNLEENLKRCQQKLALKENLIEEYKNQIQSLLKAQEARNLKCSASNFKQGETSQKSKSRQKRTFKRSPKSNN